MIDTTPSRNTRGRGRTPRLRVATLVVLVTAALLTGCATGYDPRNARMSARDQIQNANPSLNCPAGTVVFCDVEGGRIVGRTYGNCRCSR